MQKKDVIDIAKKAVFIENQALNCLIGQFDDVVFSQAFCELAQQLSLCTGKIVVSGVGKSGLIGKKIVAIFSSIGVQSIFIHPVEAIHGDLGAICNNDVLLALSCSGNTEELQNIVNYCNKNNVFTSAITCNEKSWLGDNCKINIAINMQKEAIEDFPIPTTSSILTLAVCDALTACLVKDKKLTKEQYGVFHCGGSIGKMINKNK